MRTHSYLLACFTLAAACGGTVESSTPAAGDDRAIDAAPLYYYRAIGIDTRKCAWPMCGGVFVERANQGGTRCADGKLAKSCYVAEFDFRALGLPEEQATELAAAAGAGQVVVAGRLQKVTRNGFSYGRIVVSEAWLGRAGVLSTDPVYRVEGLGIRCIAAPCPQYRETLLNTSISTNIAELDLGTSGAPGDAIDEAMMAAFEGGGAMVAGYHETVTGPAGSMPRLVASDFYTRVVPRKPAPTGAGEGQACGGFAGTACAEGLYCDVNIDNACSGADLSGVCVRPADICTQIYDPVCGCDGKTYSNDCFRRSAQVQKAYDGACVAK